jgi:hypothetical protein
LRLSEDAACNRIEAARACRRFPQILDLLAAGALTLSSVRLLGRHLTAENHQAVLARAAGKSRREIDALAAPAARSLERRQKRGMGEGCRTLCLRRPWRSPLW